MKRLAYVTIFFMLSCLIQIAAAEEKTRALDPITVIGEREKNDIQETVTKEDISLPVLSGSVLDSLKDAAGVQFRRSALTATESSKLRIRGFDETRLGILRDGVSIQRDGSYGNGPVDWSAISAESVGHIEIYKGAGPAKFGNTIGGIVNIVTARPSENPETRISSTYGSYDTWDSRISDTRRIGPFAWSLSASHFETDGYLRNSFGERNNIAAKLFLELPSSIEAGVGVTYSDMENGSPVYNRPDSPYYENGKPDADAREPGGPGISARLLKGDLAWGDGTRTDDENSAWNAFVTKKWDSGRVRFDYQLWNQDRHEVYYDAADKKKKIYERDTRAEDNNWLLQAEAVQDFAAHHIEAGGVTRRYGWGGQDVSYIEKSYFNPSINFFRFVGEGFKGQPKCLEYHALYLQDRWQFHPRAGLAFGLRQEWFKADTIDPDAFGFQWKTEPIGISEHHLDPRVAFTFEPWEAASIKARFGIVHRYPNSPEYFWWYLNKGTQFFNTGFTSEKSRQYELSYEQPLFGFMETFVRGYYYDVDNYIASTFVPKTGMVFYNIREVTIKGAEMGVAARFMDHFSAWANFTWQKGKKDGDPWDTENRLTHQLADFPEKMFNIGLTYDDNQKFSARLSLNFVDARQHFKGAELERLGSYALLNLSASWRIWETTKSRWELLFSAENLLDEDYQEEQGYPMPGVTVMGGLRVTF